MRSSLAAAATITANDLRRIGRDRTALFFMVVLPVVIIVVIGSTFGGDPSIEVGVVDGDGSAASARLVETVDAGDGLSTEDVGSTDQMRTAIRTGSLAGGIVVPDGYGERLAAGDDVTVELLADPTSATAAAVQSAVRAAVGEEAVVVAGGRAATAGDPAGAGDGIRAAATAATSVPLAEVRTEVVDGGSTETIGSFDYTAPANLVLFTFVNTIVVGSILALERRQGITRRMLATPHGPGTILAGLGISKFAFALLQSSLIVVIGAAVFGVGWGDPVGATLVVVTFAALSTTVGLLVGTLVSGPEQAQALATPVAIGLGMLGGCMWPLAIVPPAMRTVGHIAPHAWAMDAWVTLVLDGGGVADIVVDLAVLAAFTVVIGTLARRRLLHVLTS